MSAVPLDQAAARRLIGEIFVYHMPFNRALGLELDRLESDYAELSLANQTMLVGNSAQKILHGGVIASVLDVAAGLVCVTSALTRQETITDEELRQRLSRMGTIDLRVDYLRPGISEYFELSAEVLRLGSRVASTRMEFRGADGKLFSTAAAAYIVS